MIEVTAMALVRLAPRFAGAARGAHLSFRRQRDEQPLALRVDLAARVHQARRQEDLAAISASTWPANPSGTMWRVLVMRAPATACWFIQHTAPMASSSTARHRILPCQSDERLV
jgi:hypothetical protein